MSAENQGPEHEDEDIKRTKREAIKKVWEDVRENGVGAFIPGFKLINNAIWYGLAAVGITVAGFVGHYIYDGSYEDDYRDGLKNLADRSALACGLDDPKEQTQIYAHVTNDVKGSTRNGFLNWIPVVGDWLPKLAWLPNKQAYDSVNAANDLNLSLYPAGWFSGYKDGIQAVLYNDGVQSPVMNYKSLNDGQFRTMMDYVAQQRSLPTGALVLIWNGANDEYEIVPIAKDQIVAGGQTRFGVNGVYGEGLVLPANKCGVSTGLTDHFPNWIPGFGGEDESNVPHAEPTTPEETQTQAPADDEKGPGMLDRAWNGIKGLNPFGGSEEEEKEPEMPAAGEAVPAPAPQ